MSDRAEHVASLHATLEAEGHRVLTAESALHALALLDTETAALVLVEQHLCTVHGEKLARWARKRDAAAQIVVVAGHGAGAPLRETLRHLGVVGYHVLGDGRARLLVLIDAALAAHADLSHVQIAERLKTELLGSVSHEFRTPLNVIMGYVDMLADGVFGACPPESHAVLEKLRANAGYLLELADEFLDLSRLEASSTPGRRATLNPIPLLREMTEWFTLLVRDKPITFEADIPPVLPVLAADEARLRVVLQNLLSNAAKFTHQGRIRLTAAALADGRVAIRVSDTGPGIAPEHHQVVFDMFRQVGPAEDQRKGVGLGLALARRFTRVMGGDITLESALGQGATFTVVLPAAHPPAAAPGHAA